MQKAAIVPLSNQRNFHSQYTPINHLPVYHSRRDLRAEDLALRDCHDIPIQNHEVRFLPGDERADGVLRERRICSVIRHPFEGLLTREALVGEPT